jgi:hypothetical protein
MFPLLHTPTSGTSLERRRLSGLTKAFGDLT